MINSFSGKYHWLSNFYLHPVYWEGIMYPSSEHAYQAAKTLSYIERRRMADLETPGHAKREGRKLEVRSDWEEVKLSVMEEILRIKFDDFKLAEKLVGTGNSELVEGNYWKDVFWGVDSNSNEGENHLGKILMNIRKDLRENKNNSKLF